MKGGFGKGVKITDDELSSHVMQGIALTILAFTICAAFASTRASGLSTKAVLAQNAQTDAWSYYEAKSIKLNLNKLFLDELETNEKADGDRAKQKMQEARERIERYEKEIAGIEERAREYRTERDEIQKRRDDYVFALNFLQIGILFASVAAIFKRKLFWYVGGVIGGIGVFQFLQLTF